MQPSLPRILIVDQSLTLRQFIQFFYNPTKSTKARDLSTDWKARLEQFDIYGTIIFLPMIICLLLALTWGGSIHPWGSWRIILLLVMFGVLLVIFTGIQFWKQDNGTVPPRILKQRSIAGGAWFAATLGAAFFVLVYYLPIWFQAIKGASAVKSGVMNIPMVLSLVLFSMAVGVSVTALGYYTPFIIASSVFMAIGAGLISTFETDTGAGKWIGYQIVFGAGVGFGMQNTLIAAQAVLPKADIPLGESCMIHTSSDHESLSRNWLTVPSCRHGHHQ